MRKVLAGTAIVVGGLVALGACGGSDSKSGSDGGTSSSGAKTSTAPVKLAGKVNDKGTKDVSGDGMAPKLEIEADDFYFSPTFVKVAPGATVTVELKNEGKAQHTFTVDGGVDQQLAPGAKATVTVTAPKSGSLQFHCDFHGAMGMQGAFFTGSGGVSPTSSTASSSSSSGY
jgi:plastocyanin